MQLYIQSFRAYFGLFRFETETHIRPHQDIGLRYLAFLVLKLILLLNEFHYYKYHYLKNLKVAVVTRKYAHWAYLANKIFSSEISPWAYAIIPEGLKIAA